MFSESDNLRRHWWFRPHCLVPPGICNIPLAIPRSFQIFLLSTRSTERCSYLRPSGMWKDYARKSTCQGVWRYFYQHCCLGADEQMVWRVQQVSCRVVQPCEESTAIYHLYWWDRFVSKGEDEGWSRGYRHDESRIHDVCDAVFFVMFLTHFHQPLGRLIVRNRQNSRAGGNKSAKWYRLGHLATDAEALRCGTTWHGTTNQNSKSGMNLNFCNMTFTSYRLLLDFERHQDRSWLQRREISYANRWIFRFRFERTLQKCCHGACTGVHFDFSRQSRGIE